MTSHTDLIGNMGLTKYSPMNGILVCCLSRGKQEHKFQKIDYISKS